MTPPAPFTPVGQTWVQHACARLTAVTPWRVGSVAVLALATAFPAAAQEAPYQDVHRLLKAGQLPEAAQKAEGWLGQKPRDPQMRFLKSVIQSEQGLNDAAQETLTTLIQDYPELPEPYNNLAVLHAAAQRYAPAREALEMAVKLNPSYAVAYQNLGDVYVQLAGQAYRQALQLNPENAPLRPKLKAVQALQSTATPAKPTVTTRP